MSIEGLPIKNPKTAADSGGEIFKAAAGRCRPRCRRLSSPQRPSPAAIVALDHGGGRQPPATLGRTHSAFISPGACHHP
jgi:hypothetical protein